MLRNSPTLVFHTCLYITILISLMYIGQCSVTKQLKYENCSSSNLCFSCYNQFFCSQCAPNVDCCPKYCKSCINMTFCIQCEEGFQQVDFYGHKDWRACSNNNPSIDPRRMTADRTKCKYGYYFDQILQFCEKCLIPNCKLCQQSLHCSQCQAGFIWTNGTCTAPEVEPNPNDQKDKIQACNKQERQSTYLGFLLIGILVGVCFSYILIKSLPSVKTKCGAYREWLWNKYNNRKRVQRERLIIEAEVVDYVEMQPSQLSDQQKQFAILSEVKQDRGKMNRVINNLMDPRIERKPIITQQRNRF